MRTVLPHSLNTLSEQNASMEKRFQETDQFAKAASIDYTDDGRNADHRKQLLSQAQISDDTISEKVIQESA